MVSVLRVAFDKFLSYFGVAPSSSEALSRILLAHSIDVGVLGSLAGQPVTNPVVDSARLGSDYNKQPT